MNTELTLTEQQEWDDSNATIVRGFMAYYESGLAIRRVRDARLYRDEYTTFEECCRQHWGISKTQANRLVLAAEVAQGLAPIGVKPATESVARELARLPVIDRGPTWLAIVSTNERPTAKGVREAVDRQKELKRLKDLIKHHHEECVGSADETCRALTQLVESIESMVMRYRAMTHAPSSDEDKRIIVDTLEKHLRLFEEQGDMLKVIEPLASWPANEWTVQSCRDQLKAWAEELGTFTTAQPAGKGVNKGHHAQQPQDSAATGVPPMNYITLARIRELEPRFAMLEAHAEQIGQTCLPDYGPEWVRLKHAMTRLVGWECRVPELRTHEAYDVAIDRIAELYEPMETPE